MSRKKVKKKKKGDEDEEEYKEDDEEEKSRVKCNISIAHLRSKVLSKNAVTENFSK